MVGSFNRPGYKQWKKTDEDCIGDEVFLRGLLTSVNIEYVGHPVESVKRNTDRKYEIEQMGIAIESNRIKHCLEFVCKKIIVFKNGQDAQIVDDAEPKEKLGGFTIRRIDLESIKVIEQRTQSQ